MAQTNVPEVLRAAAKPASKPSPSANSVSTSASNSGYFSYQIPADQLPVFPPCSSSNSTLSTASTPVEDEVDATTDFFTKYGITKEEFKTISSLKRQTQTPLRVHGYTLANLSNYKYYAPRYATFATWPKAHPINPTYLARGGFLYSGEGDKVVCPWCRIQLVAWENHDKPFHEHKKHSPKCEYVKMVFA